jgi:hypothetical protein
VVLYINFHNPQKRSVELYLFFIKGRNYSFNLIFSQFL